jgi:hypothetical protein
MEKYLSHETFNGLRDSKVNSRTEKSKDYLFEIDPIKFSRKRNNNQGR